MSYTVKYFWRPQMPVTTDLRVSAAGVQHVDAGPTCIVSTVLVWLVKMPDGQDVPMAKHKGAGGWYVARADLFDTEESARADFTRWLTASADLRRKRYTAARDHLNELLATLDGSQ